MPFNYIIHTFSQTLRNNVSKYSRICARTFTHNVNDRYKVHIVPALKDNYMYLLVDGAKKSAIAVDPVEHDKILDFVKKENLLLNAVLTTHHHFDHAGGNALLCEKVKDIPVYGGDDRIEALTIKLSHNELFQIGDIAIRCLHTPCHTSGHVCYFMEISEPICFTGDTLFVAGCGRFFEGSAEQMFKSLNILQALPLKTKIFCGHEYTLSNLKFAHHVEPSNNVVRNKIKTSEEKLKRHEPTVPSTIEDELSFNPFLRVHEKSIQDFTQQVNPVAVIKTLRDLKDNFKS